MDDYNVSVLSEAKNEYSLRLVGILTPLILEGVKSILKEAWQLCLENDEEVKYLMTFQNFLSRVTKWNQTIIDEETARILSKSGCSYLEDLLTCVHITQLKILTSIRVSQKQKKIELDIPRLTEFIHKAYIKCARKFYSNVYLFEQKIPPLQYQKNMRECETICKDCILDVIRDNMPVEHILRSYMDESVEEEVIEEEVPKTKEELVKEVAANEMKIKEEVQAMKNLIKKGDAEEKDSVLIKRDVKDASGTSELAATTEPAVAEPAAPPVVVKPAVAPVAVPVAAKPAVAPVAAKPAVAPVAAKPAVAPVATPAAASTDAELEKEILPVLKVETAVTPKLSGEPDIAKPPTSRSATPSPRATPPILTPKRSLSFNDVDKVFNHDTLEENTVSAPKTIERLEEISKMRTAQRKAEEEDEKDEDAFKISDNDANIDLDIVPL